MPPKKCPRQGSQLLRFICCKSNKVTCSALGPLVHIKFRFNRHIEEWLSQAKQHSPNKITKEIRTPQNLLAELVQQSRAPAFMFKKLCVWGSCCVWKLDFTGRPFLFSVVSPSISFLLFVYQSICLSVVVGAHFSPRTSQLYTHTHRHTCTAYWHRAQTKPQWSSPWQHSQDELTTLTSVWTHTCTQTHTNSRIEPNRACGAE